MAPNSIEQLAHVIRRDREALLVHWRSGVATLPAAHGLDVPTLNDHIPDLIEEIATALLARSDQAIARTVATGTPPEHGRQRLVDGFDISEVVAEYNILRGCVHDLAIANGLRLEGLSFHILNDVLDGAIGVAVQTFAAAQANQVRQRREEYLGFIAHDLRTPLHAISLVGRVLERTLAAGAPQADAQPLLNSLRRNAQHLQRLVDKILEENVHVAADDGIVLARRCFDLWPLVGGLLEDLRGLADPAGTSLFNAVPDDLVIYADADALRRILQNLVANAIRHAPGGTVRVGAELDANAVTCTVADDGLGIAADALERIFDKGETDAGAEGSSGLGLAIVRQLVEAHGGTVTAESWHGEGAQFRLTLPLNPPPA